MTSSWTLLIPKWVTMFQTKVYIRIITFSRKISSIFKLFPGPKQTGLCAVGQTISGLTQKVRKAVNLAPRVVVMIGFQDLIDVSILFIQGVS